MHSFSAGQQVEMLDLWYHKAVLYHPMTLRIAFFPESTAIGVLTLRPGKVACAVLLPCCPVFAQHRRVPLQCCLAIWGAGC